MKKFYVFIINGPDNKNSYVGTSNEVLDFLDKYQNQPGKNQDFPHQNDKLVFYDACESAEEAEMKKQQIVMMGQEERKKLVSDFNPGLKSLIVRFTQEEGVAHA